MAALSANKKMVLRGAADWLWSEAWHQHLQREGLTTTRKPNTPDVTLKAAADLLALYEKVNAKVLLGELPKSPTGSDAEYIARFMKNHRLANNWEDAGMVMAEWAVTGRGTVAAINVPTFSVKYARNELTWEGSGKDRVFDARRTNPSGGRGVRGGMARQPRVGDRIKYTGASDPGSGLINGMTGRVTHMSPAPHRTSLTFIDDADGESVVINTEDATAVREGAGYEYNPGDDPMDPHKVRQVISLADLRDRSHDRDFRDVPHTKTVAETRALLARLPESQRCDPSCPGWIVSDSDKYGTQIEVCDECNTARPKAIRLSDDDVAQLPEAKAELAEALAQGEDNDFTGNPSGKRWYAFYFETATKVSPKSYLGPFEDREDASRAANAEADRYEDDRRKYRVKSLTDGEFTRYWGASPIESNPPGPHAGLELGDMVIVSMADGQEWTGAMVRRPTSHGESASMFLVKSHESVGDIVRGATYPVAANRLRPGVRRNPGLWKDETAAERREWQRRIQDKYDRWQDVPTDKHHRDEGTVGSDGRKIRRGDKVVITPIERGARPYEGVATSTRRDGVKVWRSARSPVGMTGIGIVHKK